MDRHRLQQLQEKVGELHRHGSPSCMRKASSIMRDEFENVLSFALDLTKPKPKPKHTIADNYPAGGLRAAEPCMYCEDYEKLQEKIEELQAKLEKKYPDSEFTKIQRLAIESCEASYEGEEWLPIGLQRLADACDRLDARIANQKDLLDACKVGLSYINAIVCKVPRPILELKEDKELVETAINAISDNERI